MIALAAFLCLPASAQKKKRQKKNTTVSAAIPALSNAPKTIAAATKNCKKHKGYITFYQDTILGTSYLELDSASLNKQIIYFTYSENGLVTIGLFKGSYRETSVIKFDKVFDKINVSKINTGFYFDSASPLSKSKNTNISDALVASEKILASDKNGNILINADNFLSNETMHQLTFSAPMGISFPYRLGRINPAKTYAKSIRSYPENSDIIYTYTFDNGSGNFAADGNTADSRYVTVELQHSFIKMPDENFKPRYDDPRIGYFTHQVNDMTTVASPNYKDLIHRWRLEKKDPQAAISDPIKPITWWIENTTPLQYRETIKKAALTWNVAFEPIGFKNAIEVKIQPDDATWDAGDIRYNVLRWTSSPNPPFGGYGPSFVNPLTGEILGADIMLEWIFLTNRMFSEDIFEPTPNAIENLNVCSAGHHLHGQCLMGKEVIKARGGNNNDMSTLIEESLFYLILHEMGHTFGLNHNMRASQLHKPDVLNNKALTTRIGLTGSVMDYPAINFAPSNKIQGQYVTTTPGPYDLWAIDFGYSISAENAPDEKNRLQKLLSKSNQPELAFGNDADDMRSPGKGIDPRVMIGDLSGDAIAYAEERMKLCQELINKGFKIYSDSGESLHNLRKKIILLANEYNIQAGVVSRFIGGVYVERSFFGEGNSNEKPYTPVALADQKRAMNLLTKNVFGPVPIYFSDTLLSFMQPQRRGFGFYAQGEDPKMHNLILGMQSNVLDHLLSNSVLTRLVDASLYGNQYDITNMMSDLTNAIFKDDITKNVNSYRQNLQIEYINRLINIAGVGAFPSFSMRYNHIASARAFAALENIKKMLEIGKNLGDESSKQHKSYLIGLINKAMQK